MSYTSWPPLAVNMLILTMLIGGGIGSTAGGIKLTRVYLMIRTALLNIRKRLTSPRNVETIYYYRAQGKTEIDSTLAADTTGFVTTYLFLYIIGTSLITVTSNCSLTEAMFEFASALGTVGLSIGLTSPATGNATLVVEMLGMMLGRLEIFIVLTGIYSAGALFRQKLIKPRKSKLQ